MQKSLFLSFIIFLFAFAGPALAKAADDDHVFTIENVQVDITANNAADAREQAFTRAREDAFKILADRLLPDTEKDRLAPPDAKTISTMIRDYEITKEKLSSVRYIGSYTFRFNGDAVRRYITSQKLHYTDVGSKPVLVLPFYRRGGQILLWGEDNPWLAAWSESNTYQGLVPVTVPIGDLQDVSDISGGNDMAFDPQALKSMIARYDAGDALILVAVPYFPQTDLTAGGVKGNEPNALDIMLYRTDKGLPVFNRTIKVRRMQGEYTDSFYKRAVQDVLKNFQKEWKTLTIVDPAKASTLQVRVRFRSMREWVETNKALKNVQGVEDLTVLSLTPNRADIELRFQGSESRLRLALSQADMTLSMPQFSIDTSAINDYGRLSSPLIYDLYLNKYRGNR